jgi:hypothetical protein
MSLLLKIMIDRGKGEEDVSLMFGGHSMKNNMEKKEKV